MGNLLVDIVSIGLIVCLALATLSWAAENPKLAMDVVKGIGGKLISIGSGIVRFGVDFSTDLIKGHYSGKPVGVNITTSE